MLKKILMAALAVGTLTASASVADAAAVTGRCTFHAVAQAQVTGGQDTYTGAVVCVAVSDAPTCISVHAEVRVNGGTVASTAAGACAQFSVSGGQVTFTAGDTDTVVVCAVWVGSESGESCSATSTQQIPPQEVIDLITQVTSIPDFLICPVFASLSPGVPGVIDINSEGDIAFPEPIGPFWDCPPYTVV